MSGFKQPPDVAYSLIMLNESKPLENHCVLLSRLTELSSSITVNDTYLNIQCIVAATMLYLF